MTRAMSQSYVPAFDKLIVLPNESKLWSFLGFVSSIVGLVCYALSSSFKHLFGEWNHLKLLLYIMSSLIISSIVLFVKKIQVSRSFIMKSHLGFLVLMLTSLYSYFYDKTVNGKPDALNIVSYTAFAFMSLCFSRKMELGFEVGLFNFFLGFLTIQLMEISLIFAFVAAILCYSLIICRCYSDSQLEILPSSTEDCVSVRIDSTNGETQPSPSIGEFLAGDNQQISLSFQYELARQGSISGENISGRNDQQNHEEEESLSNFSVQDETADQENVTSENKVVTVEKQISSTGNQSHPQYKQSTRRAVTQAEGASSTTAAAPPSRYTFLQYLRDHKPPLTLARCSGAHVIDFLKYLDQFGKTKVHVTGCLFSGNPDPPAPCTCPRKQAWASLDALVGQLGAVYEENGGRPKSNPFNARVVRIYLRKIREEQAKARGVPYKKKKHRRIVATTTTTTMV